MSGTSTDRKTSIAGRTTSRASARPCRAWHIGVHLGHTHRRDPRISLQPRNQRVEDRPVAGEVDGNHHGAVAPRPEPLGYEVIGLALGTAGGHDVSGVKVPSVLSQSGQVNAGFHIANRPAALCFHAQTCSE